MQPLIIHLNVASSKYFLVDQDIIRCQTWYDAVILFVSRGFLYRHKTIYFNLCIDLITLYNALSFDSKQFKIDEVIILFFPIPCC